MGCGQEQHHSLYSWQETNSEVSYNRKPQKATSLRGLQQFQKGYVDKPCGILYVAKAASFIIILSENVVTYYPWQSCCWSIIILGWWVVNFQHTVANFLYHQHRKPILLIIIINLLVAEFFCLSSLLVGVLLCTFMAFFPTKGWKVLYIWCI